MGRTNTKALTRLLTLPNDTSIIVGVENSPLLMKTDLATLKASILQDVVTPTTAVIDISSAEILTMGASPIELLAAPGSGKYYDIEEMIFEYTHVGTAYTLADTHLDVRIGSNSERACPSTTIKNIGNRISYFSDFGKVSYLENQTVLLGTLANTNPTLGDGTLRVIITYTVKTFGA